MHTTLWKDRTVKARLNDLKSNQSLLLPVLLKPAAAQRRYMHRLAEAAGILRVRYGRRSVGFVMHGVNVGGLSSAG